MIQGYKTSQDYTLLKQLLRSGKRIVVLWNEHTEAGDRTEAFIAHKGNDPGYMKYYYMGAFLWTEEDIWKGMSFEHFCSVYGLSFIEPDDTSVDAGHPDETAQPAQQVFDNETIKRNLELPVTSSIPTGKYISPRLWHCLKAAELCTFKEICQYPKTEILNLRNLGKKSFELLEDVMTDLGLSFDMRLEDYGVEAEYPASLNPSARRRLLSVKRLQKPATV